MTIVWRPVMAGLQTAISGVALIQVLTSGGSGYTSPPAVTIDPPESGGVQAVATASMGVATFSILKGGLYMTAPSVALVGGGGSGASCTATLAPHTVASLSLQNGGTGYTSAPKVQFSGGGGSGATATVSLKGGVVTGVVVTNGGSGYAIAPTVTFSGGGGSGASATVVLESSGAVSSVAVTSGGSYSAAPTVTCAAAHAAPAVIAAVLNGVVQPITINTSGSVTYQGGIDGYSIGSTHAITISPPDQTGGTPATASLSITSSGGFGAYSVITSGGSGYSVPPTVTIDGPDDPSNPNARQATATATILGPIVALTLLAGGSGYSAGTSALTFSSGGATGTATITTSAISAIQMTNGGSGYATAPTVAIVGPTAGATATATASSTPVTVGSLVLTSPGQGYTSTPIVEFVGGGGSGASATATLAPSAVASIYLNLHGSGNGYASPPQVVFSGGSGLGAVATCTLQVISFNIVDGGYIYATPPNVTMSGGGGSGANAIATLTPSSNAPFALAQAENLLTQLELVGEQYDEGVQVTVTRTRANRFLAPPPVSWAEVDAALQYAGSILSRLGFNWPASWSMTPLGANPADYVQIWGARALYFAQNAPASTDPFIVNVLQPLLVLAQQNFVYLNATKLNPPAGAVLSSTYADNSPLGAELSALVSQAAELAEFLIAA